MFAATNRTSFGLLKSGSDIVSTYLKTPLFSSEKRSILIFPHGTRTQHNTKNEIQSGVVSLYKHLNIKVIPIKLNSGNYWGRKRFLKRPGKIIVEFLKPIKPGLKPGKFRKKLKNIL